MSPSDLYQRSQYHFDLPERLIAQHPCEPRDASRLLVVDRASGRFYDRTFCDLASYLNAGDLLLFNDTRVLPARLRGKRPTGGKCEFLLLRPLSEGSWLAMAKPGKKLQVGQRIVFGSDFILKILGEEKEGLKRVAFEGTLSVMEGLERYGEMPLPHYIYREQQEQRDEERYQTVYAREPGAVAAPTAGLHFSKEFLYALEKQGVRQANITLHVGAGTFRPVQVDDIRDHAMHTEWFQIPETTAQQVNTLSSEARSLCVGTTTLRALESAAQRTGKVEAGAAESTLFIYPGYQFHVTQSLLTNFHLPSSSLFMLVCALGGYECMQAAYQHAVQEEYRFFSYGDAMLIL